jgi:hypothetical protein
MDDSGHDKGSETRRAMLHEVTDEVRRLLGDPEHEPVGVLTAYKRAILRLADAVDRLADSHDEPR